MNDALSCCCWVFVRRVEEGCSPKFCSMPCLCLCVLSRVGDVNSQLNYRRNLVIQWGPCLPFFSLQMGSDIFFPSHIGVCFKARLLMPVKYLIMHWPKWACWERGYAFWCLNCFLPLDGVHCVLWGRHTHSVQASWNHLPQMKSELNVETGRFQ